MKTAPDCCLLFRGKKMADKANKIQGHKQRKRRGQGESEAGPPLPPRLASLGAKKRRRTGFFAVGAVHSLRSSSYLYWAQNAQNAAVRHRLRCHSHRAELLTPVCSPAYERMRVVIAISQLQPEECHREEFHLGRCFCPWAKRRRSFLICELGACCDAPSLSVCWGVNYRSQ